MALFKIEDLSFKYPEQSKRVLKHIHVSIQEGSFVTVCGKSGCGKTTLLRHLKSTLTPYGMKKGQVYFKGIPLEEWDPKSQTMKIGYVLQNPEEQIVTDKVWHELAFGLESLGYDSQTIRLRVAEMASFFGIQHWFHREVSTLSGGQKQILNLASIMVMGPEVLILDEPTAQLDPIAARHFLEMLKRINVELGTTVILSAHDLEEVLTLTDEVLVMDKREKLIQGPTNVVGSYLKQIGHDLFKAMPTAIQLTGTLLELTGKQVDAVTVKEGRQVLKAYLNEMNQKRIGHTLDQTNQEDEVLDVHTQSERQKSVSMLEKILANRGKLASKDILQVKEIYFRYEKNGEDLLKGVSLNLKRGNFYALVGGNGTGKTTLLSIMAGIYKPHRGKIKWLDQKAKISMLPQNPKELFDASTVREELLEMTRDLEMSEKETCLEDVIKLFELETLLDQHPYDLSGGQMQCVALAKVLLLKPDVLLLDEPTKGMDVHAKERIGSFFEKLKARGVTLVMVSHDLDFCARYSDECALFFDGQVISSSKTKTFFMGNRFYTTAAHRMSQGLLEACITSEEVACGCKMYLLREAIND